MHSSSMHTVREVSLTETPGQRPPGQRPPGRRPSWTETPQDRDPPGRNMRPSTETPFPEGKWDQAARQDVTSCRGNPPGQND